MNRADWERQIYASDLNPTARWVAAVVGSFGNWNESREVWPSVKAIADMAGLTRGTTQNYIDAFIEQGWLRHVRTRPGNIKVFELLAVDTAVVESSGILAKPKRGNQFKQLSNAPASSCRIKQKQLSNQATSVVESPDTNIKEPTTLEPTRNLLQESPVSDEPVASLNLEDNRLEEEEGTSKTTPLIPNRKDVAEIKAAVARAAHGFGESAGTQFWKRVAELATDEDFKPEVTRPGQRVGHAQSAVATEFAKAGGDW